MTLAQTPTPATQAENLVVVFWLIIGVIVACFLMVMAYRWWNADSPKKEPKVKYPSWFHESDTPETERLDKVIMDPGDVTSVRVVNPNVRCGDSEKGEVVHHDQIREAVAHRPGFDGGWVEVMDPDTGEIIGAYREWIPGVGGA